MGRHVPCWQAFAAQTFLREGPSHFCGVSDKTLEKQACHDKSGESPSTHEHCMSNVIEIIGSVCENEMFASCSPFGPC